MRLLRFLIALIALAGLVDSVLALRIHREDPAAAPPCAVSARWDCGAVNHSRFSVFPPEPPPSFDAGPPPKHTAIPVATVGIVGYGLIVIASLMDWMWVTLQLAEIGFGCALLLSYMEAYVIEKWCIYCVWSQIFITAILVCTIIALVLNRRARRFAHSAVATP